MSYEDFQQRYQWRMYQNASGIDIDPEQLVLDAYRRYTTEHLEWLKSDCNPGLMMLNSRLRAEQIGYIEQVLEERKQNALAHHCCPASR